MAIDSRDKRASASALIYGMPRFAGPAPTPDGTISAADRMHITGFYRGIAAAAPAVAVIAPNKGLLLKVY